jgi:serine/threonine protein kinase
MDFNNINLRRDIEKGIIPDNENYNKKKIISGTFGGIYLHSKKDDDKEDECEYIIEKKFLQTKNDLMYGEGQIFISYVKELFIQKLLNKYLEEKITIDIIGYKMNYEYINNISINERLSIISNYIENDLRDVSGESFIRNNFVIIVKKILNILSKIHSMGIVHLDIKPGNLYNRFWNIKDTK